MTDSLKAAYSLNLRYADIMIDADKPVKAPETSEEIINRICKKIEGL